MTSNPDRKSKKREKLERDYLQILNDLFDQYSVKDQTNYYRMTLHKYQRAAEQVNLMRGVCAFLAGFASAAAGFLAIAGGDAAIIDALITALVVTAIISPAVGGAFTTLADLYQWDRMSSTFDEALRSLRVADALSPDPAIKEAAEYRVHFQAFVEGSLTVMKNEAGQWGQLIMTPRQTEEFLRRAQERAELTELQLPDDALTAGLADISADDPQG